MAALILEDGYLKLKSFMAEFHNHDSTDNLIYIFDSTTANPLTKNLIQAKAHTKAYFNNMLTFLDINKDLATSIIK